MALHFADRSAYEQGFCNATQTYSVGTSIERFSMPDNLMMVGAVDRAGNRVKIVIVPPGEELAGLAGFRMCLQELRDGCQEKEDHDGLPN